MTNTKNIIYYSILAGLCAIPFIPFIVPTTMFFPFITGKGFTFRIIVEIIFGLYVLLALYAPEYRPKDSWITRSVLAFTFIIFIADLLGQNSYKSIWSNYERMEGFVLIVHMLLYYIVTSSVLDLSSWRKYLNLSIFASSIMSLYGLLQIMGKATINQGGVRVDGTFGNASYFAIYLAVNIFLCLFMLSGVSIKSWQRYIYGLVVVLEVFVLYFTATRGAILGLIGGVILASIIVAWKERGNKIVRKVSYGFLGVLIALIVVFIGIRQTDFVKNSPVLSRFSTLSYAELQTQGRYFVWPMAVSGFLERPILGWGQENFNYVFNKYYDPRMYGQEEWFDRTHDIFLDWLIAGGLLGFLSYLSMYVALLYLVLRKESNLSNIEKSIFIGMISGYIFHNIFVFDNLISYILFFTILGFIHSTNSGAKTKDSAFYKKVFSKDSLNYAALPLVIISTVVLVYMVNIPAIKANTTLIKSITPGGDITKNLEYFKKAYSYNSFGFDEITEQLVQTASAVSAQQQVPDTIKNQFKDFAEEKIVEKINKTPHDARYLVFAGSYFGQIGKYDEALKYLDRALEESPKKQTILFELGTMYIRKGDTQKMFDLFKKAYELQPNAKESINIYALGAIYTKNTTVINELKDKIDPNALVNDNRFLNAFSSVGDYNMVIEIMNARLKTDSKNPQYKLTLASAYSILGQKQKAIDILNEIVVDHPEHPEYKADVDKYIQQVLAQ